jgi:hypothetical protein
MDRKVVTFFADSLRQINSWTGIHQVDIECPFGSLYSEVFVSFFIRLCMYA